MLADFILQPEQMVRGKSRLSVLSVHCGIFFIFCTLFLIGDLNAAMLASLAGLSILHGLIDWSKTKAVSYLENFGWFLFLADQALHLTAIALFAWYFDPASIETLKNQIGLANTSVELPLVLSLFVFIVIGGGFFTSAVCTGFLRELPNNNNPGIAKAGRYIGVLERALVMAAVLSGKYEIIGFLLAAKSIVRYPEMKDHVHFAEYFLIGTLTSLSWAFFGSMLLKQLLV